MALVSNPSSSWVRLLALFTAASFIEGIAIAHMTAFIPLHLPVLGVLQSDVARVTGMVVAISSAIGIPFISLWGALADRYARQPIILRSFIFYFLALVIMMLAGNIWVFIAGRALLSFIMGNTGLMLTTLTERAPKERTGLAFTMVEGAIPIGASIGPFIGGPIVDEFGFRTLMLVDSVLMGVVIAAMTLGYRDSYRGTSRKSVLSMAFESYLIIFRSPRLATFFPAMFLIFTGWTLAFTFTPIAITTLYQGDDPGTVIGLVFGFAGLVTLVLSPSIGMLADRFGHWRTLFVLLGLLVLMWPWPALAGNLILFAGLWAILGGLGTGTFSIAFSVLSSSVSTEVRGRVMALSTLPIIVGFMIGPAIGSVVTKNSVFVVYPIAAVLTVLGIGVLTLSAKQSPMPTTPT